MYITSLVLCLPYWDSQWIQGLRADTHRRINSSIYHPLDPRVCLPTGIDCSFEMIR